MKNHATREKGAKIFKSKSFTSDNLVGELKTEGMFEEDKHFSLNNPGSIIDFDDQ